MSDAALTPVIEALLRPEAYPHPAGRVRLIQTHISYVFLTRDFVYKVKKAVDFGFLDYSTLAKRRYYCGQEVKLNRLLCKGVYLGVVPIRDDGGRIRVGGRRGEVVEYAVKMRRLPEERMLNRLIERGEATAEMVERVADKLIPFHQASSQTSPAIARYGDWAIRYNWAENIRQWQPYIGRALTPAQDRVLTAYGEAFLARRADVMRRRVEELRVRRTHSDLRSDAVCVSTEAPLTADSICILDCVEFNRRINLVDIARDVGFLAMDLEYRGRPDLAEAFIGRYLAKADDPELREVLPFYAAYNACVRGKVEAFLLDIPSIPKRERQRARVRSQRYFDLACGYAKVLPPALLVITCGLPGTGKSSVATALAARLDADVISSDVVRKRLAGMEPEERATTDYRAGIYATDFTERSYDALVDAARGLLLAGQNVILDASYQRREHRKAAARLARETGAQFVCLEVTADAADVRARLERRVASGAGASDADWRIHVLQKRRFQRPTEVALERRLAVDTSKPVPGQVQRVMRGLRELSPLSVR